MIKWKYFFGNSSTEEALAAFVKGHYTFNELYKNCWPRECKMEIKKMQRKGYKKMRPLARQAMNRHCVPISNYDFCYL